LAIYGLYDGQVLTEPPECDLVASLQVDLMIFGSEENARQHYDRLTNELRGVLGVLAGRVVGGVAVDDVLITKQVYTANEFQSLSPAQRKNTVSNGIFRYNDHQGEYGAYLGEIIVRPI
jgi:hypothetical protein